MPRLPATPVKVTVETGPLASTKKTHPSFGLARFSRVSGDPGQLFGSEINHNSFIRFTLGPGESHWRHHETYYHGPMNPCYVEVEMSAAQFAELLTSMNVGSGVPCTIRTLNNAEVPGFTDADNLHEQIKDDIAAKTKGVTDMAADLATQLETLLADSKVPKAKQEAMRSTLYNLKQELNDNMPFIIDQYQEAAEKVKAKCAAEVDAMFTHAVQRLGLERMEELKALAAPKEVASP